MPIIIRVFHVEWKHKKAGRPQHEYFASQAAIYQCYDRKELGVAPQTLSNYFSVNKEANLYENNYCRIHIGNLIRRAKSEREQDPESSDRK